ncbi:MATE family efflux transporter [Chloroflexota bacterium]
MNLITMTGFGNLKRDDRGEERESRYDRDWTKGNIFRNLLLLSWPMIVSNSLMMMGPTIDMIWVGKLGSAAIAGVGVSGMAVMVVNSARQGLSTGTRAMIARFVGEGDSTGANHVAQQAFVISGAFSVLLAAIGIFLAEPILIIMGVEADVVSEGAAYMRIMFVGSVAMSFRFMTDGAMQASGDTINPMKLSIFYRIFHVVLCPFLVFGWWIFPRLGVSGAAITNVFSQSLGMALGLWYLFTGRTRLQLTFRDFHVDPSIIWRIVKIGIPSSISGMQMSFGQLILIWFMVPFGTAAVAAHTLCQRVEMFLFMPGMAMGIGAGVLAGQNLGAGQPERAEKGGWIAVGLVTSLMVIGSMAILLWAESIVHVFTSDPGTVEITSSFLRIATVGYLALGTFIIFMECLSGVGDTLPPLLVSLLTFWLVNISLAYFLSQVTDLGVYGIRWAMVVRTLVAAVALATYFKMGRWKRKKV